MAEKKEEKTSKKTQSSGNKGSRPSDSRKEADPKETAAGPPPVQAASSKESSEKSSGKESPAKAASSKESAGKEASAKAPSSKDSPAKKPAAGDDAAESESYLKDLMSISGHGGLFRFVSQGRNGVIVESLETGKRMQAFSSMKVSALEDIAVYTNDEEMQLEEVFAAIHKYENGKEAISPKSEADELKDYFSAVLPEYDRERVYVSDIKKILGWYNLLLKQDLIEIGKPPKKAGEKKEEIKEKQAPAPKSTVKKVHDKMAGSGKSHTKTIAPTKKTGDRKVIP